MRVVALIFGILGGLAAAALGAIWFSQSQLCQKRPDECQKLARLNAIVDSSGGTEKLDNLNSKLGDYENKYIKERASRGTTSYILLGCLVLGVTGGILGFKGKGKTAALIMIAGPIAAAVLQPLSLIATGVLVLGAILSLFAHPKYADA